MIFNIIKKHAREPQEANMIFKEENNRTAMIFNNNRYMVYINEPIHQHDKNIFEAVSYTPNGKESFTFKGGDDKTQRLLTLYVSDTNTYHENRMKYPQKPINNQDPTKTPARPDNTLKVVQDTQETSYDNVTPRNLDEAFKGMVSLTKTEHAVLLEKAKKYDNIVQQLGGK